MSDESILDRARREPWNYGGALLSMYDALAARLAEEERLLREWVADACWDPRANLPDLVNRTRHAIGAARTTDSAPAVCPKCSGTGKEPVNGGTGWYRCPCGAADSVSDPLTTPEAIKGNAPDPLIAQPAAPVCSFCGMPDCEYLDGECVTATVSAGQESKP